MPKNKSPAPKKSDPSLEEKDDAATQLLCDLAVELVEREDSESAGDTLKQSEVQFHKAIKKALAQKKDDVLYEALERARDADRAAFQFLKDSIEDAAGNVVFRHDDGSAVEVNAFVVPLYVWSTGGLDSQQCFQDQEAFELLTKSFKDAHLESPDATVVLVNHAYHLDEIDSITYSHLNEMVRNAHASMTDKKATATPAIERSMFGWPANPFGPDDQAVELRFLLGFALKKVGDAFYMVPQDDAAADQYFDERAGRFQQWTDHIAPVLKRCLVRDVSTIDVKFLYQDLFHSGKETGMSEYFMLQMMAELTRAIEEGGIPAASLKAVVGPATVVGRMMLRVNLYAQADGMLTASVDKACGVIDDIQSEFDDVCDALKEMNVTSLSVAAKFDELGQPHDVRVYVPREK